MMKKEFLNVVTNEKMSYDSIRLLIYNIESFTVPPNFQFNKVLSGDEVSIFINIFLRRLKTVPLVTFEIRNDLNLKNTPAS